MKDYMMAQERGAKRDCLRSLSIRKALRKKACLRSPMSIMTAGLFTVMPILLTPIISIACLRDVKSKVSR